MAATSTANEVQKPLAVEHERGRILLGGDLRLDDGTQIWRELRAAGEATLPGARLDIDLSRASSIDGAIASLLVAFRASLHEVGGHAELVGADEKVARLVRLHRGYDPPHPPPAMPTRGVTERTGDAVIDVGRKARTALEHTGDLVAATAGVLRRPATGNWRAVFSLMVQAGTDAIPIVLFLDFLVGFVMGYQSARQLEIYGANVFVADVVGISVTREIGPLVTGMIIIGRSGAGFAAEIGTMKVSEELDALRTMGISPQRYLVLPRILALVLVAPALSLLGDVVSVLGGAVVGVVSLGVSPRAYVAELRTAVFARDILGGLGKTVAFGLAIGIIACQQGLATRGGATGVGRRTTSAVVMSLFGIVILDAIFAVIYRVLGT